MKDRMRQLVICVVGGLLVLTLGCVPRPTYTVETQVAAEGLPLEQERYKLGAEDVIEVAVWKEPDLTKQLVVRPDGKISYPLIGDIPAAGKTVKELQEDISKRLEKFVTDASVSVILLKAQHYKIYVTGKVNRPGEFLVGRPTTVMQAIAMAGGLTPFASPGSIAILRKGVGQDELFPFDYNSVSRGQMLSQDRILLPGDVVVVP